MSSPNLDADQLDRYGRQIVLEAVGPDGQDRLLDSAVLVVGAGGLGAPVLMYLAGAGVGTVGVADPDVVERSNLQRQVIHGESDLGRPKVESAAEFLAERNPDVSIRPHELRVVPENAAEVIADYDFVVDATDSFQSRFLLNDACTLADVPFSQGAVSRFSGQVTTFDDPEGPCYRCLFPEAPPPGTVPDCAAAGVLGVVPGTIGCLQATETLKSLLGLGESLSGRLLHYDALALSFETVSVSRSPDCPVCRPGGIESVADQTYAGRCRLET